MATVYGRIAKISNVVGRSNYLNDDIKKELVRQNVLILDIKNIKKMQKGRDMVGEILRDQEYYKENG